MRLRLALAAIDIDRIAQGLEGVEGDPHRQQQIEIGNRIADASEAERLAQAVVEQVEVLVEEQDAEARAQPGHEIDASGPAILAAPHRKACQ